MRSEAERKASRVSTCRHFTGYQNVTCKAGLNYRETAGREDWGWAARLPCVPESPLNKPGGPSCAKYAPHTVEEIEAEDRAHDEEWKFMSVALKEIKTLKGVSGSINCPKCKMTLVWTRAKLNGHVWGNCTTKGCLQWMM